MKRNSDKILNKLKKLMTLIFKMVNKPIIINILTLTRNSLFKEFPKGKIIEVSTQPLGYT